MKSENKKYSRFLRVRLVLIASFLILLLLIFSLKKYPGIVETYYSLGLYPLIRRGFQVLFNYIPFSAGDVLYVLVIAAFTAGLFQISRFLIQRKFKSAGFLLLGFFLKLQVAIAVFYLLWALNYFRRPASERLKLSNDEYNEAGLMAVTAMLIDSVNLSRSVLRESDLRSTGQEVTGPAVKAIQKLSFFDPPLIAIHPNAKPSLLSPLLNYIGTSGYYNPFTGEAQFNDRMPVFIRPFVACHEMAHQMGFGAEDEANFIGFMAGKSSGERLLKYSSYYLAAQEFMAEVWRTDSTAFKRIKQKISPDVIRDLETERAYWTRYQGRTARLSSIFYDNYLKANKQPGGLKTYNRMIKLTMAYYRKTGFIK